MSKCTASARRVVSASAAAPAYAFYSSGCHSSAPDVLRSAQGCDFIEHTSIEDKRNHISTEHPDLRLCPLAVRRISVLR